MQIYLVSCRIYTEHEPQSFQSTFYSQIHIYIVVVHSNDIGIGASCLTSIALVPCSHILVSDIILPIRENLQALMRDFIAL